MLKFAGALDLVPASIDMARLDALAEAAGLVRGTVTGAPAFRMFASMTGMTTHASRLTRRSWPKLRKMRMFIKKIIDLEELHCAI
ncbi:MAG: hypothetical protein H7176_00300 [Bdellovibrionales bacterium]|nr:hypothetical protein [Massilia sp.]